MAADPRVESRTYHLDGANIDVPYCVYKSTKVSRNKAAPLIVALHGMGAPPSIMCNKTSVDLAEEGGYILVAPMGYSTTGWYGSPVINMGGRGPGAGARPGAGPGAPPGAGPGASPGAGPAPGAAAAPAGPSNADIEKWSEADVMNVLATMCKEFNVDAKRIYLTGHSMGGAGTLFLANKHADIWAAAAPVAPASFMMNNTRADILKGIQKAGLPLMIVQGDADTVVPATNTRLWVDTAREIGLKDFQYVEQPGIDHGPVITTSQKEIFEFFAAHSKK
jgi:poly(3-hydroxybutyrate) depolymerase